MRALTSLSQIIAMIKLLPLLFFVCFGLFSINSPQLATALLSFPSEGTIGEGALAIFYAFGGFEGLVIVAGEMKNPKKDLPIVLLLILSICAAIYFLIQVVAMGSLGPELGASVTPIADVADLLFGAYGKWSVMAAMLLSMTGINLAASFITPRAAAALSEDKLLPASLSQLGSFGTPGLAIAATAVITLSIAYSGSFAQLVTVTAMARFVSYTAICTSTLVFQKRDPSISYRKQPWKLILPLFSLSGIAVMLFLVPFSLICWGLAALALGVPLFFFQKWQSSCSSVSPLPSPTIS